MDAKILEGILDSHEIAFVNPFCEKNNPGSKEPLVTLDLSPASKIQNIAIDSYCNAPFHFEINRWEHVLEQETNLSCSHTTPDVPQIFRKSFYPPPKVV